MDLGFADHSADGIGCVHNFKYWNQSAFNGGDELLRYNGLQKHGKLYSDLLLLVGRENVDNPVNGVCSAYRVQS